MENKQTDLMKLSVAELVYDVCSDPEIGNEFLVETFFTYISNVVLNMKRYVSPEVNIRIDHLLNGLKRPDAVRNLTVPQNFKRSLSEIISIDREIDELIKKKIVLHQTILPYAEQSVSDSSSLFSQIGHPQREPQAESEHRCISQTEARHPKATVTNEIAGGSSTDPISGNAFFSRCTVRKSLEWFNKQVKLEQIVDHKSSCDNAIQSDHGENTSAEISYVNRSEMTSGPSSVLDDSFFNNRVSFEISGASVSCITMYKRNCLAGTHDGFIIKFLKNGKMSNKFLAHEGEVSSVIVWKPRLLSTSVDGTLNILDMKFNFLKKIGVGVPITCSRELKGILYLGTKNGHLIMYNIRALTRMGDSIQVAQDEVTDFEIMTISGRTVVAVAIPFHPVTIRDTQTGALLLTLKNLLNCNCLASTNSIPSYLCGVDRESFALVAFDNGVESLITKKYPEHGGSHIIERNGLFYCGGYDGHIYVYNELGMIRKKFFGTGEPLKAMSVGDKKIVFATCTTITSVPLDE